jgi:hypothetical protein
MDKAQFDSMISSHFKEIRKLQVLMHLSEQHGRNLNQVQILKFSLFRIKKGKNLNH